MTKGLAAIAWGMLLGIGPLRPAIASTLFLDAPDLFERSVTHSVQFNPKLGVIELELGELIEDDGPASGRSCREPGNVEELTDRTCISLECTS